MITKDKKKWLCFLKLLLNNYSYLKPPSLPNWNFLLSRFKYHYIAFFLFLNNIFFVFIHLINIWSHPIARNFLGYGFFWLYLCSTLITDRRKIYYAIFIFFWINMTCCYLCGYQISQLYYVVILCGPFQNVT